MRENAIFTVTPPDLMLPESGPLITVVSTDSDFVQSIETLYENIFNTVSVVLYHPAGKITENNSAWMLGAMRLSDTVYVDVDSLTELSIALALSAESKNVYINNKNKKQGVVKILNSTGKQIFDSLEDYSEFVTHGIEYA